MPCAPAYIPNDSTPNPTQQRFKGDQHGRLARRTGKAHETQFKLTQEQEFKAEARRNRLLGEWLAERFGLPESEVADYAKSVVVADPEEPGVEDVMRKVMKDIAEHEADISEDEVREKLEALMDVAKQQIADEAS